jgi:hypothetical protein
MDSVICSEGVRLLEAQTVLMSVHNNERADVERATVLRMEHGEVENYADIYRLCYVRGPEGIIVELAERIG